MDASSEYRIEVKNVVKKFGDITALNGVDLAISSDGIFGLLGPNGAGKSTLIMSILGLHDLDGGEILIDNKPLNPASNDFKRKIGIIPQELAIYDNLPAITNLKFFGSLYGLSGADLDKRAHDLLEFTGLQDRAKDCPKTYSGGMKRRLNLAAGIIHKPELVMMDEPTVGIDPQSRNLIYDLVENLANDGMTVLYTTHYMDEAERLCRNLAIIDQGKIIAKGTLDELIDIFGENDVIELDIDGDLSDEELSQIVDDGSAEFIDNKLIIQTSHGGQKLQSIMNKITSKNCEINSATIRKPNLETVFLHLTGKELRD